MAIIGKLNNLRVVKEVDFGLYLDGGEHGEILLPLRYVPDGAKPDDILEVFIYLDSEDRIIATTEKPFAMVDEFAYMKVVSVNSVGAFLDWGLMKDLLVPFREQKQTMEENKYYLVYVYVDMDTKRIAASAKIDKYLDNVFADYEVGQEVDLLIANKTDLGFTAIINHSHWGIIYENEVFKTLKKGQHVTGYIKKIRDDEKIDLSLQKPGFDKVDNISKDILAKLQSNNGFIAVTDRSHPEIIYQMFGISKKAFKMAVGTLYKSRLITLEQNGIYLKGQNDGISNQ